MISIVRFFWIFFFFLHTFLFRTNLWSAKWTTVLFIWFSKRLKLMHHCLFHIYFQLPYVSFVFDSKWHQTIFIFLTFSVFSKNDFLFWKLEPNRNIFILMFKIQFNTLSFWCFESKIFFFLIFFFSDYFLFSPFFFFPNSNFSYEKKKNNFFIIH